MWRTKKTMAGLAAGLLTIFVGTALALANVGLITGNAGSFDFGSFGPGYPVPATIQIHAFTMKPGDTIPWHYHKALSYVILVRGTLSEQHLVGPGQCGTEQVTGGSAFAEPAGLVHTVTNSGNSVAVIWWATVFPKSDGIAEFSPSFQAGGVYPATPPNCN